MLEEKDTTAQMRVLRMQLLQYDSVSRQLVRRRQQSEQRVRELEKEYDHVRALLMTEKELLQKLLKEQGQTQDDMHHLEKKMRTLTQH